MTCGCVPPQNSYGFDSFGFSQVQSLVLMVLILWFFSQNFWTEMVFQVQAQLLKSSVTLILTFGEVLLVVEV